MSVSLLELADIFLGKVGSSLESTKLKTYRDCGPVISLQHVHGVGVISVTHFHALLSASMPMTESARGKLVSPQVCPMEELGSLSQT